jgi:rod shape-determining protein MreD
MKQRILSDEAMRLDLVPVVATAPFVPPFGLMMLLAWRLLRPELWPAWAGLPLGLFDDLITGHAIGSSMALWTILLLVLDIIDAHLVWRDFLVDWLIGGLLLLLVILAGNLIAGIGATTSPLSAIAPQMLLSVLVFPAVMRIAAGLDRWRLPTRSAQ